MKNILAFAGSSSSTSINKQLATYAANTIKGHNITILDLNDFELPLYSIDLEKAEGIPLNAHKFLDHIQVSDGLILSLAEHNGAYTTVFKNLFDWLSRIEQKTFSGKPMLLMATSPGGRGGQSVLAIAKDRFPFHDAKIVGEFSLPFFDKNFSNGEISEKELKEALNLETEKFVNSL